MSDGKTPGDMVGEVVGNVQRIADEYEETFNRTMDLLRALAVRPFTFGMGDENLSETARDLVKKWGLK